MSNVTCQIEATYNSQAPIFATKKLRKEIIWYVNLIFWCQVANDNRRIHLYLPDNYDQSDERYAVLYMFDGHNLFFDQDATFGKSLGLKEFLDAWWKLPCISGTSVTG